MKKHVLATCKFSFLTFYRTLLSRALSEMKCNGSHCSQTFRRCFIILASVVLLASCGEFEPKYADSPELKSWILRNCISYSYQTSLQEGYLESIGVSTENPTEFTDYCVRFFDRNMVGVPKEIKCQEFIQDFFRNDYDWKNLGRQRHDFIDEEKILLADRDETKSQITHLIEGLFNYVETVAEQEVAILNWIYNEDALADSYTGYLVEYEIGTGYFVLVNLTEYDDSNRYAVEIIYKGESLTELHQCYE